MRVQRAPRSADQPQLPPEGFVRRDAGPATPAPAADEPGPGAVGPFFAEVDLDLTGLGEEPAAEVFGEVVVALVGACLAEGLVDLGSALRVVAPTDAGLAGARVDRAVDRSASAVAALRGVLGTDLPAADERTLTVVDARGSRARPLGDWGLGGGSAVATLGPVVSTVVAHRRPTGLVLGERRTARLGVTVPDGRRAAAVVRALDAVARSVEQTGR